MVGGLELKYKNNCTFASLIYRFIAASLCYTNGPEMINIHLVVCLKPYLFVLDPCQNSIMVER